MRRRGRRRRSGRRRRRSGRRSRSRRRRRRRIGITRIRHATNAGTLKEDIIPSARIQQCHLHSEPR
eukprot:459737-Pyramimonas_sp.AAC.1